MSSDHVQLQAAERTAFGSAASRRLRRQGLVPGILYQAGKDAVPFQVPHHDLFMKLQVGHGKTAVFEISVGGAPAVPALLKDWQMNPVRAELEHVDFQQVDLKVAVQASVPLVLVGQSQGVRDGGVLDQPLREITYHYDPNGVHPTPYLRVLISIELLRRMGFQSEAERYARAWTTLYPKPSTDSIPAPILSTAPKAIATVVDALCYQPFAEIGNRSLAEVYRFGQKEQRMIEEAARRLASGDDPGIVPARFLIGAARFAIDNQVAPAAVIQEKFYKELARR